MVTSSSNIQLNLHSLAQTNGGHVCYQIESQTTNLCLTSPRCKCCEHRCFEHLLGGSGRLCLLSCSTHTKSHTGNEHLQVQDDNSSTRVVQNALVLGSCESVNQTPITTRLGQLGTNISPDRSSLTPQVLIGNFLKHNYPLLYELQHINLLCLYLPKEDGVSPDAEYITEIIFSIFLQ